jgi:hypothetical protein
MGLVHNFDNLTERLIEELKSAAMHFDLYNSIKSSIPTHKKGINKSPNFWSLTLNAHLEATRCALCKIYDQTNKNNLTIKSWLEEFQKNHCKDDFFKPNDMDKFNRTPLTKSGLEQDLELVSLKDPLVEMLYTKHRNNEVAHLSNKLVSRGESFWQTYPLTREMMETLISRANTIVNKYTVHYNGTHYQLLSIYQKDDYKYVVDSVEKFAI